LKIELTDDNGLINDGKPTLVVLVIDGRYRIPYEATKTIQELYVDAQCFLDKQNGQPEINLTSHIEINDKEQYKVFYTKENEIERQDIVECFHVEKDLDGNSNPLIDIGKQYRVVDIYKQRNEVTHYDVLDDTADFQERIQVLPTEIKLIKKHVKQPPRKTLLDKLVNCPKCGDTNALVAEKDSPKYEGQCGRCGFWIVEERKVVNV